MSGRDELGATLLIDSSSLGGVATIRGIGFRSFAVSGFRIGWAPTVFWAFGLLKDRNSANGESFNLGEVGFRSGSSNGTEGCGEVRSMF